LIELEVPRAQPADVEQVADQHGEAADLPRAQAREPLEVRGARLRGLAAELIEHEGEGADRRSQLVRGHRHQLVAREQRLAELDLRRVELGDVLERQHARPPERLRADQQPDGRMPGPPQLQDLRGDQLSTGGHGVRERRIVLARAGGVVDLHGLLAICKARRFAAALR